jgi:hypothetical protein
VFVFIIEEPAGVLYRVEELLYSEMFSQRYQISLSFGTLHSVAFCSDNTPLHWLHCFLASSVCLVGSLFSVKKYASFAQFLFFDNAIIMV